MRGTPTTFRDFSKGINLRDAPYLVDTGYARDARNVRSTERGALRRRPGSTAFCSPAAEVKGLFAAETPTKMIATTASSVLGIAADGTITTLATGLDDAPWCWVRAPATGGKGPFFGCNGLSAAQAWDGVAASSVAWAPTYPGTFAFKYMTVAGNRVWVITTGDGLLWSNVGDPTVFPSANVTEFDPSDGQDLSGIGTVGPYVLVFKPGKTWVVYDLNTSANRPLSRAIGCVSHRSIAETPKGTFFLSREGVYRTDGQALEKVSGVLDPLIAALPASKLGGAAGCYFDGSYYLAVCQGGTRNDLLLEYDLDTGAWWIHTFAVAQPAVWTPGSSTYLYAAKASATAKVLRIMADGVTTDENSAFEAYWKSAWHAFDTPFLRKRMRQVHMDGMGVVTLQVAKNFRRTETDVKDIDFAEAEGYWETDDDTDWEVDDGRVWEGDLELGEVEAFSLGTARAFSVIVRSDTDDDFRVDQYTTVTTMRKD